MSPKAGSVAHAAARRADWRAAQDRSDRAFFWACMAICGGLFALFVSIVSLAYGGAS